MTDKSIQVLSEMIDELCNDNEIIIDKYRIKYNVSAEKVLLYKKGGFYNYTC